MRHKSGLVPTVVYDSYWRFAVERQTTYLRRVQGERGPWSGDPILRRYRFTNAYRAADRVSQYLIREVQYRDDRSQAPAELFFRTMLFKLFNRVETWEAIEARLGPVTWQSADLDRLTQVLDRAKIVGSRLYSAAYIMPSPAFGHAWKHANHLALLWRMMDDGLPGRIAQARELSDVYALLLGYPGLGPFLAFQYAIDLNYSTMIDFPEGDFVVAGPGALDGIAKCFNDTGGLSAEHVIHHVTERQEDEFARLGLNFPGLWGRKLQPIDCQNLFCEISKYARVAHPEIEGQSGRTRIKQSYTAATRPSSPPFFPPKWGLALPEFATRMDQSAAMDQGVLF